MVGKIPAGCLVTGMPSSSLIVNPASTSVSQKNAWRGGATKSTQSTNRVPVSCSIRSPSRRAAADLTQNAATSSCTSACARGCLCHSKLCSGVEFLATLLIALPEMLIGENLCDPVNCPVHLLAFNNQRWGDAHDVIMRICGQDAATCECLAVAARAPSFRIEFNGYHKAAATNLLDRLGAHALKSCLHICALFRGVLDHPFLDENAERGPGHRAGEWIAAKGRAMIAGLQATHELIVGKHGRYRIEA